MAFVRKQLFQLRMKLLLCAVAFLSIAGTVFAVAHQVRAVSTILFNFTYDGHSPDKYGQLITSNVWQYVYEFDVSSDDRPISSVEYEIDSGGRQSLSSFSTTGAFDDISENIHFELDQKPYADGSPHTITFYATTDLGEENSQSFPLEPVADVDPPSFYFDTWTEGIITETPAPFIFDVYDDYISNVTLDIDGDTFSVSPQSSAYDNQHFDFDLSNTYFGAVDIYDGNSHTFTVTAEDPYGNTNYQSYSFTYDPGTPPDLNPPVFTFTTSQEGTVSMPLLYEGYADDFEADVSFVKFQIDGGSLTNPTIDNENSTPSHKVFTWDLSYLSAGPHVITWVAEDTNGNQVSQDFSVTIPDTDTTPPVLGFTTAPSGNAKKPLLYEGTAEDADSQMSAVTYSVDGGERQNVTVDSENSTLYHTAFSADLSYLADGTHEIVFYATDVNENESSQTFNIDLDSVAPTCTASWTNLTIPHYSKVLDYPNITCTDNRQIVDAEFNVYHVVYGTLRDWPDNHVTPQDGTNDESSETYDLHIDLSSEGNIDGVILAQFRVTDEAGNTSYDYDPVTIDATDNTAPSVNLDQITPDPLTDTTPTITGSCRDSTERETNTHISNMGYRIDGGSYTDIVPLGGHAYDTNYSESFSVDLPELDLGSHTVDVRCSDGASHTSTASDTFTIQAPTDPMPGQFTYTENFNDPDNQDIPSSNNVVWGNGKLRLKENITTSRTLIQTTSNCERYGDCRGLWSFWQDPVDSNKLWYYQGGNIYTYNTSTNTSTLFDYVSDYGLPHFGGELNGFAIGVYGGKEYLWISDIYSLSVINLTDHTAFNNSGYHNIGSITLDFARGRMAAYVLTDAPTGYSNIAYLNLNNTMSEGDDVFTRVPLSTGLNSDSFLSFLVDPSSNAVYSGAYSSNLYKWNDHNNPADPGSFDVTFYSGGAVDSVFSGMTLDPQNRLIFGTANNSNGHVYVISDDGGTPFDTSDDTMTEIASPQQIGYRNVYGIQYVTGQNGVGDQLILQTETDNPVYVNFNSTYDNRNDDTFIDLDAVGGIRPGKSSIFLKDYNTAYVNVRNQGVYKMTLNRGWVSTGDAVALPTRPPEQLIVDNFVAEANVAGLVSYVPDSSNTLMSKVARAIVPYAQAVDSGVHYYVSTDGGVTWTEVTLGQLQQLQQSDYRVKFKISLNSVGGATPVLDSYSLAYAGYPTEVDQSTTTGLSVTPSSNSVSNTGSMSLTIEAVDVLGYKTPGYNGSVSIELIDNGTGNPTTGLSVSSANIVNGTVTLSGVQINKVGSFKIRATSGSFTKDSSVITVTDGTVLNSPYLGFSASSFKIKKGETVTLHWASSNLTSFVINPGNNQLTAPTGDFYVHPTETTTYTITGSGPYGSASSSLTVTVEGELSVGASPSPSPSVSPYASVRPSATPGTGVGVTLYLNANGDQTIVRGQKADVSWDAGDADEVTVDYPELHTVSPKGSFEFYPTDDTVVTIRAKKGDEVVEKKVTVRVLNAPQQVQELARSIQEKLPWSTPIISNVIQATRAVPGIGLGLAAVLETGVVSLLVASVVSQVGLLAAFNGKTLLNILTAAGILPARHRKGFVHQARNGAPIPFASITVYEGLSQRAAPLMTLVSDMYGVYLEPFLPKGQYTLVAAHSTHNFPTKLQRPVHLSFKDFYRGEALAVASSKEHPALLIPMDAKTGEEAKHKVRYRILLGLNRLLHILQWTVYPLAVLSLFALWLTPTIFNVAIVGVYAILLIPRLLTLFKRPVLTGRVVMDADKRPISNATLTLTTDDGGVVALSKSDEKGNFSFFAPKGKYVLNVISNNLLWKDIKSGTLYTVNATGSLNRPLTLTMGKLENPFGGFNASAAEVPAPFGKIGT